MAKEERTNLDQVLPEIRLARHITKKYNLSPGFNIDNFIINFVEIIEEIIPLSVDAIFLNFKEGFSKPIILLNSETFHHQRRRRFTLAHEIGHYFIPWHAGLIICHIDPESNFRDYFYREMEAEANRFATELLMPEKWLIDIIKTQKNIGNIIEEVLNTGVSITATNIRICNLLPSGYLFVQIDNNSMVHYSGRSKGTAALASFKGQQFDPTGYLKIAIEHKLISHDPYTTHWFKFNEHIREITLKRDKNNSKEIINELLLSLIPEKVKRQRLLQRINGVIGATNSLYHSKEKTEFLSNLYQRFASNRDLNFLLEHKQFELYLSKKATEIVKK